MQEDHLLEHLLVATREAAAECVERPFESLRLASPVFSTFSSLRGSCAPVASPVFLIR